MHKQIHFDTANKAPVLTVLSYGAGKTAPLYCTASHSTQISGPYTHRVASLS